ncbi:hypothetical protein [Paenibacillus daejeonensis]|uniref:hypothetical protein n=1 Tax=Paenibacillus daejeonensis TaxID=135193 RepID=UPI0003703704|nr:hypothetical protein [Paenibacillus daejeonensis]
MMWIQKLRLGIMLGLVCMVLAGCKITTSAPFLCKDSQIDWANVLKVNDVTYSSSYDPPDPQLEEQKGKQVGEITYRMAGNACSNHTMRNGDATLLHPGTEIYEMRGYDPAFRVIAHNTMYQVDRNPQAETIGELWDIEDKVKRVSLSNGRDDPVGDFTEESAAAFI